MSKIGHNSGDRSADPDIISGTAQRQLKSVIDRVRRLEQEKAEVGEQIKEVFSEAKGNGFDVKVLRKVIRLLSMDRAKRLEEEAILDLYLSAAEGAPPTADEDDDIA